MCSFEKLCLELGVEGLSQADMDVAADIYDERKRRGAPIEDTDLLIAAQCLARTYTLVTNNTKHFSDISGLEIVDWTQA
ncbi:MAG: hypothetical protein FWB80_06610 [Defluviitaleaceae bacterium]|nr:hypothetical protein [Defluviitaleaceae bacterium]